MEEKARILIADDESEIRKIIRLLLERRGYSVAEAANGYEAIERVRSDSVDLIVMDIMMPRISGVEATAAIREFSNVPILFLTAKSLDSDKEKAYLAGGDDYLVKPFSSTELILKVASLLRRYTVYSAKDNYENIISLPCSVEVDLSTKTVRRAGEEVVLRDKESEIFFFLLKHRGETVETDRIY